VASYQYLDSIAEPPAQPNVVSSLVSYQYLDSLVEPPDQPNVASRLVSYLYYDWPGDENLTFQTSAAVSYFYESSTGSVAIIAQPVGQFVQAGGTATLSIVADGQPPLNYQWKLNNSPLARASAGSLTITNAQLTDAGNYTVIVSNVYGSVTSATAKLDVLAVDTSVQCSLMTVTPLPPRQPGMNNVVVVTHGWQPGWTLPSPPQWVSNLCDSITNTLYAQGSNDWQVVPYFWVTQAWTYPGNVISLENSVLDNAHNIGTQIGRQIAEQGWQHVHLIAHSAGGDLIQSTADAIRANAPSIVIHTTFLDPFVGLDYRGLAWYGTNADWSDCYYAHDWTDDPYDIPGYWTSGPLANAYNVDISWADTNKMVSLTPVLCPGSTAESTAPVWDHFCRTNASITSSHDWPHDFYLETIRGTETNCAIGYGFPLSTEGGGWNRRTSHPVGNNPPLVLCEGATSCESLSRLPVVAYPPLQIGSMPVGTSISGVNVFGWGFNLNSAFPQTAPQSNVEYSGVHPLGSGSSGSTDNPCWLAVGLTITNPVNFAQFEAEFTDTNGANGLLTVYWDTNQIGAVHEIIALPGLQTYRFALPSAVLDGLYVLGFRLDAFNGTSSAIAVTNIGTGFVGITQPLTLGITLSSNHVPIMKLTGTPGQNYLVQSSTNLMHWNPTALLTDTNGIVFFVDPATPNSGWRFYRALLQ
jgi:hypothetical protein